MYECMSTHTHTHVYKRHQPENNVIWQDQNFLSLLLLNKAKYSNIVHHSYIIVTYPMRVWIEENIQKGVRASFQLL